MNILSHTFQEAIALFRKIALEIDRSPANISKYLNEPAIKMLAFDRESNCLQRTLYLEALAYGDAGVLLAAPGPSLSGLMLRELGNPDQQNYFFNFVESHCATSFLAVTEPLVGSDASKMQTRLNRNASGNYELIGEKWLVGHGADADIGVVIARLSAGPLGLVAVLLTKQQLQESYALHREHLPMVGLRGARLSRLIFNHLRVPEENILGLHLRPVNRGMMALIKTFNRMRPCVAAFALGNTLALLDYVKDNISLNQQQVLKLAELFREHTTAQTLLYRAAQQVDVDPYHSALVSMAKVKATILANKAANFCANYISMANLLPHPIILKWLRDMPGYEFMEGTSNMQRKNISNDYLTNIA